VSNSDLEDLDSSTALDRSQIKSSDELQDLNGHVFISEDDRGRQGVNGCSSEAAKVVLAGIGYRMQSIVAEAVFGVSIPGMLESGCDRNVSGLLNWIIWLI
jgi:hypothetical protein